MIKRPNPNFKLLTVLRKLGVRQIELAHTTRIDPSIISKAVNGWRTLSPDYQQRIAQSLDVPVKDIF